jgi:hypothetical protein
MKIRRMLVGVSILRLGGPSQKAETIGEMEEALRAQPDFKEAKQDLNRLKK